MDGKAEDMDRGDWHAVALALASLASERPGWEHYLGEIARKLELEDRFRGFLAIGRAGDGNLTPEDEAMLQRIEREDQDFIGKLVDDLWNRRG